MGHRQRHGFDQILLCIWSKFNLTQFHEIPNHVECFSEQILVVTRPLLYFFDTPMSITKKVGDPEDIIITIMIKVANFL